MQENERLLRLVTGRSVGLRFAEALIWTASLLTFVISDLSPLHTLLGVAALTVALICSRHADSRSSGVLQLSVSGEGHGYLQHESDGRIPISLTCSSWCTRWVCVISARETGCGKMHYLVICRSRQQPDDYRRLLQWMRLGLVSVEYQA